MDSVCTLHSSAGVKYFMGLLKKIKATSGLSAFIEKDSGMKVGISFQFSSLNYVAWYFQVLFSFSCYKAC